MDHNQATQLTAVEKYLLDELPPEVRDEFEEHFFDCQECATDLRATAGFIDAAKREFKVNPRKARCRCREQIAPGFHLAVGPCLGCPGSLAAGDRLSERGGVSPLQDRNCRVESAGDSAPGFAGWGQQSRGTDSCGHGGIWPTVFVAAGYPNGRPFFELYLSAVFCFRFACLASRSFPAAGERYGFDTRAIGRPGARGSTP